MFETYRLSALVVKDKIFLAIGLGALVVKVGFWVVSRVMGTWLGPDQETSTAERP